jgi:hypothetical protein
MGAQCRRMFAKTICSKSTFCQLLLQTLTFSKFPNSLTKMQSRGDRFYASTKTTFSLLPSIKYNIFPYQIMREYSASIQDHREGSPAGAIRSSVEFFLLGSSQEATRSFVDEDSCALQSYEKEIRSPLKAERTQGVGRSRSSMIVEARAVQGKPSHRRRGSEGDISCLTFAFSIDFLPRAGSSRRCCLDNLNPTPDSPPSPPRRQMSPKNICLLSCSTPL